MPLLFACTKFRVFCNMVHIRFTLDGKFCMLFLLSADIFSKSTFLKNSFRNTVSVKQFGSRSGPSYQQMTLGDKVLLPS